MSRLTEMLDEHFTHFSSIRLIPRAWAAGFLSDIAEFATGSFPEDIVGIELGWALHRVLGNAPGGRDALDQVVEGFRSAEAVSIHSAPYFRAKLRADETAAAAEVLASVGEAASYGSWPENVGLVPFGWALRKLLGDRDWLDDIVAGFQAAQAWYDEGTLPSGYTKPDVPQAAPRDLVVRSLQPGVNERALRFARP